MAAQKKLNIMNKKTDEDIVMDILTGDFKSFKEIVKRFEHYIYSIGMRFFYNAEDAKDFTQEVFIKVYNNLKSFKSKSLFKYWIAKIAYNHGINKKKQLKSDMQIIEESIEAYGRSPEESHTANEIKDILLQAIDALPEKYKICVNAHTKHDHETR